MSDPLLALFLDELKSHVAALRAEIGAPASDPKRYESVVHAAHSIKGASMIVSAEAAGKLVDPIERIYGVARRDGRVVDEVMRHSLLGAVEMLEELARVAPDDVVTWSQANLAAASARGSPKVAPAIKMKRTAPPPSTVDLPPLRDLDVSRDLTMLELFQMEVEAQSSALSDALVSLDSSSDPRRELERAMRAAHSIKGAARVLQLSAAVELAHVMEDYLVAAQAKSAVLPAHAVDVLLGALDVLTKIADATKGEFKDWLAQNHGLITSAVGKIKELAATGVDPRQVEVPQEAMMARPPDPIVETRGRVVKVSAENMNRLVGMAGEMVVGVNRLQSLLGSVKLLRDRHRAIDGCLDEVAALVQRDPGATAALEDARRALQEAASILDQHNADAEGHLLHSNDLSARIYRDVMESRMRPFADGVRALPRMVRDLSRALGKNVKLEVIGQEVKVDRDILEKLDGPLTHILRNALDHGVELPSERAAAGKPEQALVKIEAKHWAGTLSVTISDDGRGIDTAKLRARLREREFFAPETIDRLSEAEVLECVFLPGLSTAAQVTDISGRGVGLDIVKTAVQEVGGSVRVHNDPQLRGTHFHLQLPLTLSVIRAVLVEIAGDPYAVPLTRIDRVVMPLLKEIREVEGRQYIDVDGKNIGLVDGKQLLELEGTEAASERLCVVVISSHGSTYGLRVTRLLGEEDLVVRPLDPRLGVVRDVSAAAIMSHGDPLLILDVDQLVQSVDATVSDRRLLRLAGGVELRAKRKKRVLIVDDSITIREVERQILTSRGFEVDVAIDGVDGLQAAKRRAYDIVITDVDMPRMNGIDLVRSLKQDERLRSLPVMIVSYKDRPEDRTRGLEAGASFYLTKSSFDDKALLDSIIELIGEPDE